MSNLRIVQFNHADAAVLTASSAVFPATNLQTTGRAEVWRAGGTSASLTADLGGPVAVDSVALMRSNLTPDALWRVRFFYDATVLFDSGDVLACPPRDITEVDWAEPLGVNSFWRGMAPQSVYWAPSISMATSVRIDVDNPSNPAGYVEASRLVIGRRWSPGTNFSWGAQLSFDDQSKTGRAEDGSMRSDAGAGFRRLAFSLEWLSPADRATFSEFSRHVGKNMDFLVAAYPAGGHYIADHYTMMGRFPRTSAFSSIRGGFFSNSVEIEES